MRIAETGSEARPRNGRGTGRHTNAESKQARFALTPIFDAAGASRGSDETVAEHYL